MENASDALRISAWVLIFVLSLSVTINTLMQAKQAADAIITYNDREYDYTYITGSDANKQRTVSMQSIIPAINRAYKENYKIVFDENTVSSYLSDGLYQKWDSEAQEFLPVYYIDLEKDAVSNLKVNTDLEWYTLREYFIEMVLYRRSQILDPDVEKWCNDQLINFKFEGDGLSERLQGIENSSNKKFTEYLGVYYQEEATQGATSNPAANKTEKRVITYKLN